MKLKELDDFKRDGRKNLTIVESFDILEKCGVPIAEYELADGVDDAISAANEIGYPVVIKIVSKEVSHKSDISGVRTDIRSDTEMEEAYDAIMKNLEEDVDIDGILVQKMISGGVPVIIGSKKDPQFGQTVLFGAGGIYVEAFDDISLRVTPITKKDSIEMIKETDIYKILNGLRGTKYDIESIVDLLVDISDIIDGNDILSELDLNPTMVLEDGLVVVDARIVIG